MHQQIESASGALERAVESFTQWRESKSGRGRIPESLWELACLAAQADGVSKTALALKVDYYRLQRRLQGEAAPERRPTKAAQRRRRRSSTTAFVELPTMKAANDIECELEFENGQGARLVLRWKGSSAPDLAVLSRLVNER